MTHPESCGQKPGKNQHKSSQKPAPAGTDILVVVFHGQKHRHAPVGLAVPGMQRMLHAHKPVGPSVNIEIFVPLRADRTVRCFLQLNASGSAQPLFQRQRVLHRWDKHGTYRAEIGFHYGKRQLKIKRAHLKPTHAIYISADIRHRHTQQQSILPCIFQMDALRPTVGICQPLYLCIQKQTRFRRYSISNSRFQRLCSCNPFSGRALVCRGTA